MNDVRSVDTPEPGAGELADVRDADAAMAPRSRPWDVLCPYLRDATGAWRATTVTSEHRCTAVHPPAPVSAGVQRTLCLVTRHTECPLYANARDAQERSAAAGPRPFASRPVPPTAGVIIERPSGIALFMAVARDSLPQVGLVFLIALAVAAVVLARFIAP